MYLEKRFPDEVEKQEEFRKEKLKPLLAEALSEKRAVYFVDMAQHSARKRLNVLGAINAVTYQIIDVTSESYINSHSVCELLDKLVAVSLDIPITLVLDNARYQKCHLVQDYAQNLGLELLYLPPYSSHITGYLKMDWDFSPQILIQGINQPEAIAYLQQSQLQKNGIVAGVADEYMGTNIENIAIFDLVSLAIVNQKIPIITSLIFSHPHYVLDACYEAIAAGIKQIVIYTPRISPLDLIKLYQKAESKGVQILGPSGAGILQPEKYNCGVKNADIFVRGNVGVINFAHETIAQEIALSLKEKDLGISTLINLGNDYFTKINWGLWLNLLVADEHTKSIVITLHQISPLDAENLILALNQIKDKPIVIYLLDSQIWRDKIDDNQTKVILDQIYHHLYPISASELIRECNHQENITVTDNHYDILKIITNFSNENTQKKGSSVDSMLKD